jgi:hypothetical protein
LAVAHAFELRAPRIAVASFRGKVLAATPADLRPTSGRSYNVLQSFQQLRLLLLMDIEYQL